MKNKNILKQLQPQPLPQNVEAEQMVLGAVLIDDRCIDEIVEILEVDDFYKETHQMIYAEILKMKASNIHIDIDTIYNRLKDTDTWEKIGKSSYITYLTEQVTYTENVGHFAKLLKEKSNDRKLATKALETVVELQSNKQDRKTAGELISEITKLEDEIAENSQDSKFHLTQLSEQQKSTAKREWLLERAIPQNFPSLIYADGGIGKSYLGLLWGILATLGGQIFLNLKFSNTKFKVLFLDFELDIQEMTRRAYQIAIGLNLLKPPDNLYYQAPGVSLPRYLPTLKQIIKKYNIDFIIIDSIGAGGVDPLEQSSVIEFFNGMRNLGTTSLLIDHQAKLQSQDNYNQKTAFGSVYKFNLSRSVFQLARINKIDRGVSLMLTHKKSNFGELLENMTFDMTFDLDKVLFTESQSLTPEQEGIKAIWGVMLKNKSKGIENTQSGLMETCKELEINKNRTRNLLKKGEGISWDKKTRNKKGGGYLYEARVKFLSFPIPIESENSKPFSNGDLDTEIEEPKDDEKLTEINDAVPEIVRNE